MLIVHVFVHVKPESVEAFRAATISNARNSVHEPGIARFDVIQQTDDPTHFVLVEVYRTVEDTIRHKETAGGLGLAIARSIVAAHGGSIHAESTVGLGTTIRFTLPAKR